jgi:hypothetical protein
MDADRRRKTITAGTFVIGCKSLSNAHPISPVGSRRTPVISMTLCSMNVVGPEGIYAREIEGVGDHPGERRPAGPGRENRSVGNGAGLRTAMSPIFSFSKTIDVPNFVEAENV